MSSSENEEVSHSNYDQSPQQVEEQISSVLESVERVRNLINLEVEIATSNCEQVQPTTHTVLEGINNFFEFTNNETRWVLKRILPG